MFTATSPKGISRVAYPKIGLNARFISEDRRMDESFDFDSREFRSALGAFTTGVTVVTAVGPDGARVGVTANSFNSVSLDPPMVLWSLARSSRSLAAFQSADHWVVHILAADQEALSNRFARSGDDKFSGVATEAGASA